MGFRTSLYQKSQNKIVVTISVMVLILSIIFYPNFASDSIYQTKFPYYNLVRAKVAKLMFQSKYKTYWYNDICGIENNLKKMQQSQRLDYYIVILVKLSDKLVKSGEGGLTYYECILEEDKPLLNLRLDDFILTDRYSNMDNNDRGFIEFIRNTLHTEISEKRLDKFN